MRLSAFFLTLLTCVELAVAMPKWGFHGEDADVLARMNECYSVVMGTIVGTELQNINYPFATVVFSVRSVDSLVGSPVEGMFTVSFPIDSLPENIEERHKFISERTKKDIGKLMVFFLPSAPSEENAFQSEWLDFREFSPEFFRLIDSNRPK
jgi:hypothetical protein